MIAKRIAALGAAVVLILGAILIRDQIDDGGGADRPAETTTLVCIPELEAACRAVAGDDLAVRIEAAGATLDRLGSDRSELPLWVTIDPLPAALATARAASGVDDADYATSVIVSSPLALVAAADAASTMVASCGDPVDWRCLGDGDLGIGFASDPDSAIGLIGAAHAATAYPPAFGDALFEVWLRRLLTSVNRTQLSTGTAIATIQVRPSAMDVAVGAEAELADERRDRYSVLYAGPMGRFDVVMAIPGDRSVPDGLLDDLTAELLARGWSAPASTTGTSPDATTVRATFEFWSSL